MPKLSTLNPTERHLPAAQCFKAVQVPQQGKTGDQPPDGFVLASPAGPILRLTRQRALPSVRPLPPSGTHASPTSALDSAPVADLALELALGLSETMADVHRRGWCDGTGGNFSCTLSHEPLRLLMAPSGVDKGSVNPEHLIVVDAAGRVVQGSGRASAERLLHQAIVQERRAGAVLHTHSQAGTLLSRHYEPAAGQAVSHLELEQLEMLKGLEGIRTHDTRVRIPVLANDQDLGRLSAAARPHLPEAPHGLLIAGHGLYAWGSTLPIARRHLEILEFLLEQHWRQLLLETLVVSKRR